MVAMNIFVAVICSAFDEVRSEGAASAFVEEKPAWYTPLITATVPDEYIPPQFLAGLGGANRQRRGSAASSLRESMRFSAREDEEEEEDGGE